jgi:hypothetical protein
MKLQLPSLSRYQVSIFTLTVIAALFGVYYFVYVDKKRDYLHQRAYRNLAQDGQNLHERYRTLVTNARREISYRRSIEPEDTFEYKKLFIHLEEEALRAKGEKGKTPFPVKGHYNTQLQFTRIGLHEAAAQANPSVPKPPTGGAPAAAGLVSTASLKKATDAWEIHFEDTVRVVTIDKSGMRLKGLPGAPKREETLRIAFRIKLADFVEMCLTGRGEVYDDYLLWEPKEGVLFSTVAGGLHITGPDTVPIAKRMNANDVHNVEIAGVPYKLFTQQTQVGSLGGLVLGGLIREQHYRAQVYEVSMFTILLSLLCMLILVLGYPFIKLRVMSPGERLQPGDAFFCTFSLVTGSFLLILLTLSGYVYSEPESIQYRRQLLQLADSLSGAFSNELNQAWLQLDHYRTRTDPDSTKRITARLNHPNYPAYYPYFDHVYTVDYAGNRRETFNTDRFDKPFVQVADREYFKRILDGATWNLGTAGSPRPCVLEPIFNRLTGENTAVLSIPYHTGQPAKPYAWGDPLRPVLAMVMKPHSVLHPVLPSGYGFCIMDGQGRVWFHSQPRKNLQEQFVKECGEDRELQAALNGNAEHYMELTYHGQQCLAYGMPLPKVPLYLVVFHQEDHYKSIRTMATSMSIIYYLLALLPLVVLVLAHKGTFGHTPLLRGENFAFRWLSPRLEKKAHYPRLLAVFSGLALAELLLIFVHVNEQDLWFCYALAIATSFAAARSLLFNDTRLPGFNRVVFWLVYGLLVLVLGYQAAEEWVKGFAREVQPLLAALLTALLATACVLLMRKLHAVARKAREQRTAAGPGTSLGHLYPASLFAWVVLAGVLPALAFYAINHQREHRMSAGHTLLQLARDITTRKTQVTKQFAYLKDTGDSLTARHNEGMVDAVVAGRGQYLPGLYQTQAPARPDTGKSYAYAQFYPKLRLRPLYNQFVADNHLLLKSRDSLQAWGWTAYPAGRPGEWEALTLTYRADAAGPLTLTALLPGLEPSYLLSGSWWGVLLLVTALVLLLGLLYGLIRYAVTQLFNFAVFEELQRSVGAANPFVPRPGNGTQTARAPGGARQAAQAPQLTYWTGAWLPGSEVLMQKLGGGGPGDTPTLYDLSDDEKMKKLFGSNGGAAGDAAPPHAGADDNARNGETPVVITHFEQMIEWASDDKTFRQATAWLQGVVAGARRVTIFSLKDHATLRSGMAALPPADAKEPAGNGTGPSRGSARDVLYHLGSSLGAFQENHFHLRHFQEPEAPDGGNDAPFAWQRELVAEECARNGPFLKHVGHELLHAYLPQNPDATRAGILLKVQALAGLHYAVLWQSCNRQEQYVLYDLAQDGLVNAKNVRTLTALLEKGLLVYDGSIRLMNRSFRNYILTCVEPDEGLLIEREIRAKGSWNEFRSALLLVISAIVVFIFLTQRETYHQIVAVLTTLMTGIPLLLKVVGTLKSARPPQGE